MKKRKKKLPIGLSDFKEIIEYDYYYFDKTKFIENILEDRSKVKLFTRPRRFGKTLNISMLKYFFDIKEKDGNYVISVPKNSDFIKESLKEQMNSIVGQSPDFNPDNVTLEYVIDKETYFPKVLSLSFEAKLDEQDVKITTTNTLSNINSVGEITVPEEALNSNN